VDDGAAAAGTDDGLTITLRRYTMQWAFGSFLWTMAVVFFWFAVAWMFIALFADLVRRDISGWAKAGWIVLMVVLPLIGSLVYVVARPRDEQVPFEGRRGGRRVRPLPHDTVDEIARAAELHDQGRISAAEYERIKEDAFSH
jgi:hypothetical protein